MIRFIGGPAFSGKSEWIIRNLDLDETMWLATGDTSIQAMRQRHSHLKDLRHKTGGENWKTVETTHLLSELRAAAPRQIVIDCSTSWLIARALELTNRQSIQQVAEILASEIHEVQGLIKEQASLGRAVSVIGGEIGACLPSPHPIERLIREVNGRFNQQMAQMASSVIRLDFGLLSVLKAES